MDCLKDYIQIEGCDAPAYDGGKDDSEPSGLYINKDLPLNIEGIDKIADSEQQTFLGVWDEVQNRGIKKFRIRVKAGYKELFGICDLGDDDEDWFCTNKEALAMALLYFLGSELMFENMYTTRRNRFTIDKTRAANLRTEFDNQFITELKSALEIINDGADNESGDVFSYVESLP